MTTTFTLAPITIDAPAPGTPEWRTAITASKVPPMIRDKDGNYAGFGYISAWHQYEQLKGRYVQEFSDFMLKKFDKAHAAEIDAINWWINQQDNPDDWSVEREVAFHNPAHPCIDFATVDWVATHTPTGDKHILEVKNPNKGGIRAGWIIQHRVQRIASGINQGGLIIYPENGTPEYHPIDQDAAADQAILDDINAFKNLLDADTPPAGGDLVLTDELMGRYDAALAAVAAAEKELSIIKEELQNHLGTNKRAVYDGKVVVSASSGKFAQSRLDAEHKKLAKDDRFRIESTSRKFDEDAFKAEYPEAYEAACAGTSYRFYS